MLLSLDERGLSALQWGDATETHKRLKLVEVVWKRVGVVLGAGGG